jgi:hypothetical protein
MAFSVSVADEVDYYIRNHDRLTISDQDRILFGLVQELSSSADEFFERNQMPELLDHYWYDFILMTEALEVREFRFICSAEGLVYGVTEVRFVDECPVDEE